MKKLFLFLIIAAVSFNCLKSQDVLTAADSALRTTYYWHSKDMYEHLPDIDNEIIFLGNSITDFGEWHELLGNSKCLNRGISGDVTDGVLLRLDAITRLKPAKIFILIGVNDLSHGKSPDYIIANYEKIIQRIKCETPETKIYVQSVLPVALKFEIKRTDNAKTAWIMEVNEKLKELAAKEEVQYIDLFSLLCDEENHMRKECSIDGLHLTYEGYRIWVNAIKPYIE